MNRCSVKHLFCAQHYQGPLDVWYDCSECEACGEKELALERMRWLTTAEFKALCWLRARVLVAALWMTVIILIVRPANY